MYGRGSGTIVGPVATTITAVVLPNTGGISSAVNLAVSVGVGLVTWGVVYAQFNK